MANNMNIENFFWIDQVDDKDEKRAILSVSVGEVWLYFYRERMIGFMHLLNKKAWFYDAKTPFQADGYTSHHEIKPEHVQKCIEETTLGEDEVTMMSNYTEMTELAFSTIAGEISQHVDDRLMANSAS